MKFKYVKRHNQARKGSNYVLNGAPLSRYSVFSRLAHGIHHNFLRIKEGTAKVPGLLAHVLPRVQRRERLLVVAKK